MLSGVSVGSIDRRVEVIDGVAEQRKGMRRISDLRSLPFVVLLGEPGIGKSTVLGQEAALENAPVFKVRELINGSQPIAGTTLFLDALDEYRTDGQPSDKAYSLAAAMASVGASRWRLSCRSEDWRKGADIAPIQRTTSGAPVVVAQLLPLDHTEAVAVLSALGEPDPEGFLEKAETFGASGFTESPLSLKLLHTAVSGGGAWPQTRFDLFSSAITKLAYERNEEHKWTERHSLESIIATASEACLLLLASGAKAIWRSNDEPPMSGDARAHLTNHELPQDRTLLRDTLDTALFRGEGEAFEPMHRTIAEYLASQALAQAVTGTGGRSALPLSRAIALITGNDGAPPTELRGLYAWFAAHLARLGDEAGASRLIEGDAATVLAYGDAAVFSTPERRAILANLDRNDPYFRASEVGITAVGGLSGEDLADDFKAVLTSPSDGTHRMLTVLEALTSGVPVLSVRPLLRSIALDATRPDWQRWRAADAWLNGAADVLQARRELFDALATEPVSTAREALRAHLAAALPPEALSLADIKSVVADFERSQGDSTIMSLFGLRQKLEAEPRPELFDEPVDAWRPTQDWRRRTIEVDDLLDHVLAASIRRNPDLRGDRIWRWVVNIREYEWSGLGKEAANALREWLDGYPSRDVELFHAILAEDNLEHGPWVVGNTYIATTGLRPSAAIIRDLLARAAADEDKATSRRLLAIAVAIARHPEAELDAYWETYDRVSAQPGCKALLKDLTTAPIDQWRRRQHQGAKQRKRQEAKTKAANLEVLAPVLADIRIGRYPGHLDWAAQLYFQPANNQEPQPTGLDRVAYFSDTATTAAIAEGWEYLATVELVGVNAAQLGAAEAQNRSYYVENAAVAGLDRLLAEDRCPDPATMPIEVAIAVLKSGWVAADAERRRRLEGWAIERLNLNPIVGAAQLVDFWDAALNAGATDLTAVWRLAESDDRDGALSRALDVLLTTRPTMPPGALRTALRAAAKHLDPTRLRTLATSALAAAAVPSPQRTIWSFVAFALDPAGQGDRFMAEHTGEEAAGLFDVDLSDGLMEAFGGSEGGSRPHREAVIVRLLGPSSSPESRPYSGRVIRSRESSYTVSRAISALAQDAHPAAGQMLASLLEEPSLGDWRPSLRHAQAQQTRLRRDHAFRHPSAGAVKAAIAGGPPVNSSDLRAVVLEELNRLRRELRTNDTTPWKRYWNVDSKGKVTTPLIENECRDHLLDRLRDRLQPYKIAAAAPEARRGEETRADVLVLTFAGRNLPVEAKRHFHPDIWVAASTQLQGYAADDAADGIGIYLVFWFGNDASPTPARPDGGQGPASANELERMLATDLPPDLRLRTDVIVFDVSNPAAHSGAKPRKKRTPKPTDPGSAAPSRGKNSKRRTNK
jgi:hypothetical protein